MAQAIQTSPSPQTIITEHLSIQALEAGFPGETSLGKSPFHCCDAQIAKNFETLQERVLDRRPVLRHIIDRKGHKSLFDYAQEYTHVNLNPPIQKRQNEFLETLGEEICRLQGPEIAKRAVEQLAVHYFVSTADHMGPLCHPFFLNSNLVTAAPYFVEHDPALQSIIVLSCSCISFDNSSFPRGLQFHSAIANHDKAPLYSCGFLGRNVRPLPVFRHRAFTREDMLRAKKNLQEAVRKSEILQREANLLCSVIDEIYLQPEILQCEYYADQIVKTNTPLWRKYFSTSNLPPPDIIYVEQESLVAQLLLKYHIDSDTIISRMIFDPEYDAMVYKYFEDIQGSFSRNEGWGTYLFWGFPKESKYRVQLWKQGDELVAKDGSYRLKLTPAEVRRALREKEIFTSTLMDFLVLSFYYGLKCLGGFNQVNYLTAMKNSYIKMNVDLENYRSIEVCARAQTKELCDGFSVAFLGQKGQLLLATGIDLLLHGKGDTIKTICDTCKNISVEEALYPLLPEMYRVSYEESEWDPDLIKITDREISALIGLDQKLQPSVTI